MRPGGFGGPALAAKTERSFTLASRCGIPASAKALTFNVTATGATAAGSVVLFPGGISAPSTSTLSYAAGATRANNGIVALGAGAVLRVRSNQASGTVHLTLDVNGYFQ
jgi:hypothetical protein